MKKSISMRINENTLNTFKIFARDNDLTFTALVIIAVKEYIARQTK